MNRFAKMVPLLWDTGQVVKGEPVKLLKLKINDPGVPVGPPMCPVKVSHFRPVRDTGTPSIGMLALICGRIRP